MPNKSVLLFKRCFVDIGFDVCNGLRHWNCLQISNTDGSFT